MDPSASSHLYSPHPALEPMPSLARELRELKATFGVSRASNWQYLSAQAIEENSPSIKAGLHPDKQARWRREFMHLIYQAGVALKVPPWGLGTAALLCHRFFSRRSMTRNDRFVIASACLHLGAKVMEAPKSIKEVVRECGKVRHHKDPEMLSRMNNPAHLEAAKDEILMAERLVLYTLGFDLNVSHPHSTVISVISDVHVHEYMSKDFIQNCWNFVNDSFRTTLCLQYPAEKLAAAAIWAANLLNKQQHGKGLEEVIATKTNNQEDLFSFLKVTPAECTAIIDQILELYADINKGKPAQLTRFQQELEEGQARFDRLQLGAPGPAPLLHASNQQLQQQQQQQPMSPQLQPPFTPYPGSAAFSPGPAGTPGGTPGPGLGPGPGPGGDAAAAALKRKLKAEPGVELGVSKVAKMETGPDSW